MDVIFTRSCAIPYLIDLEHQMTSNYRCILPKKSFMHARFGMKGADHQKGGEGGEWLLNARIGARGTIRMVHRIAQKGDKKNWLPNSEVYVACAGFCIIAS